ncbi:type VI secretion system baseplate subunit TssG [Paraburkholderia phymatum]|uniref:Type VI secretion protein, VC_A0111 family n=1 Tax=Paraburkholderia phymatum (strain DSM 17167 / CIP 108236 / LMG 21445 / STM815) TaxID=391038 RepID=B2JVR9_PARP8|nr:type VI secretion system baseplate subunit TssG [Paraburkholderia phymatum]ACC75046.1 type VI secretion protein, VC_A0111 family [Paraburkholderia phymatum STM815]
MEAMGADDGLPAVALIARLKANPQSFDLFQAISLLERAAPWARPLGRGNGLGEAVRFAGHVSLAFEASDIRSVREHAVPPDEAHARPAHEDEHASRERRGPYASYTVTTPVLTLAGANGPLPMAYTELVLARRAQRDTATADLLDIFNHRFLSFLYRSRKKHAPGLNWRSPHGSALAAALDALSNLGLRAGVNAAVRGPQGARLWMRHAGLLGAAPRSMTGLLAMLSDRLGLEVQGAQFVGGWREIDAADSLRLAGARSRAPRLGGAAVLGRRTWDEASGICIEFPGLTKEQFEALLPGGRDHAMAAWLIRSYLQQDFDVQFVLHLAPQPVACAAGGARAARLGWTSWLGGARHDTHTPEPVRLAMREATASTPTNL